MCGIAGWVSFERNAPPRRPTLEAMVATMRRRGPDAGGVWLDECAALGHRRLAVIDPVGGRQPMAAAHGAVEAVLTYSGEVYNFSELREELQRSGHEFRTRSDTEVVLHAYLEWGERMVDRLEGMYALAVWDRRAKRLLLVRDRLGIKPLYYARTIDGVVFGSEPKALFAHPLVAPRVDAQGLREAYSRVFNTGPTLWSGVREVRPGTVLTVERGGLCERVYWQLDARPHTDDLPTTVERVGELVGHAARSQSEADVPRCSLLSGGLDSSILTALLAEELRRRDGHRIRSFAVDYRDQAQKFTGDVLRTSPDAPFAREASAFIGTDHRTVVLDPMTLLDAEHRKAVVVARDSPIGVGDMDTSLYLLCSEIRHTSTVALSGEAADEVFGGYPWFRNPAAIAAPTFPWLLVTGDGAALPLHPDLAARLRIEEFQADTYRSALAAVPMLGGEDMAERRMRELLHLSLTRWLRQLLHRKDRLSMAAGLEVRVPYCDHRLVDYVFNTPWPMKSFDGREKSLLRSIGTGLVPDSVLHRLKNHYPSTHDPEYNRVLQEMAREALDHPNLGVGDFVDETAIRPLLVAEPSVMQWGHRLRLERLVDLAIWLDHYKPAIDV